MKYQADIIAIVMRRVLSELNFKDLYIAGSEMIFTFYFSERGELTIYGLFIIHIFLAEMRLLNYKNTNTNTHQEVLS
jgi:hypothetical protein